MLLKQFIVTKNHFAAPLKENKTFFEKKKSWIRRFRIRENMDNKNITYM